ncbi:LptE family protein [uncultured Mucilaginibacter sp.]|uniref:LptE family protein n=1 Tax=uncultured Mucilaginibacter sp. TaxID=797541 RepID=UPI0025D8031F|nr:LptE family protein [uncultured Mucilaginibacter sp.]
MKRIPGLLLVVIGLFLIGSSCSYSLKLSGASIPVNMKTIRVEFFENNAQLVVNNLSTNFTEALKTRIRNTTKLAVVQGEADAIMSGAITDYSIAPVSINATANNVAPIAGASRLTITIKVKYENLLEKGKKDNDSFEESFTKYQDFSGDINTQEQTLIAAINKQLTEDIFNKAFANW